VPGRGGGDGRRAALAQERQARTPCARHCGWAGPQSGRGAERAPRPPATLDHPTPGIQPWPCGSPRGRTQTPARSPPRACGPRPRWRTLCGVGGAARAGAQVDEEGIRNSTAPRVWVRRGSVGPLPWAHTNEARPAAPALGLNLPAPAPWPLPSPSPPPPPAGLRTRVDDDLRPDLEEELLIRDHAVPDPGEAVDERRGKAQALQGDVLGERAAAQADLLGGGVGWADVGWGQRD
jgi:hypothetical protein